MQIGYDAFWLQKAGNAAEEYEDAFSATPVRNRWREFRCAVADGATETSFSGAWAQILADAFVSRKLGYERGLERVTPEIVAPLASAWREGIDQRSRGKPLPWYAQEKLQQGAFSSLIGLSIRANGTWRALCVGDSCLFHVRPREAIWVLPYHTPEQFDNHPLLISTNAAANGSIQARAIRSRWKDGDFFLLMTDALAHCFLSQPHLRASLVATPDQSAFEQIVARARNDRICRNDDVTYLKVCPRAGDVQRGAR